MLYITLEESPNLKGMDERVRAAVAGKFLELADMLYNKVVENVSGMILQKQSGQLAESIRKEVDVESGTFFAIVGPEPQSPKAWALEYGGERDYAIFPTKGNALHFFWPKMGKEVWLPYVNHPPSKEFAYLRSALAELEPIVPQALAEVIQQALAGGAA